MRRFLQLLMCLFSMGEALFCEDFLSDPRAIPVIYQGIHVITGEYHPCYTDLTFEALPGLTLQRIFCPPERMEYRTIREWRTVPFDVFERNLDRPPEYEYGSYKLKFAYDKNDRITDVDIFNREGSLKLDHVKVTLYDLEQPYLEVVADSGGKITYLLDKIPSYRPIPSTYILKQVVKHDRTEASYFYKEHPTERRKVLTRVEDNYGNALLFDYYTRKDIPEKDVDEAFKIGKIKSFSSQTVLDSAPIPLAEFEYHPKETTLREAKGHKIVYRYISSDQLIELGEYGEDQQLYRLQKFFWRKGNLSARAIYNGAGQILQGWNFEYNSKNKLIKETIYGNLSGLHASNISIDQDGTPLDTTLERYSKSYTYSKDKNPVLLKQAEENGCYIEYNYDKEHHYLAAKFTGDSEGIQLREFYVYDDKGLLKRSLRDDGSSTNLDDLTNVTERQITVMAEYGQYPVQTLPTVVEEKYFDVKSGSEGLIKRVINAYSTQGLLLRQDIYDSEGNRRQLNIKEYDGQGRCIRASDLLGNIITKTFDLSGHLIEEWNSVTNQTNKSHYDLAHHLIKEETIEPDGTVSSISYRYNNWGEKIAILDSGGNETKLVYDSFHRVVKTILPEVLDEYDQPIVPKTELKYDICGNVVETVDPRGTKIQSKYNSRGQVIEIQALSKIKEKVVYQLDGQKKEEIAIDGKVTSYKYDGQKRIIEKRSIDCEGRVLSETLSQYKGVRLCTLIQDQQSIHYSYDAKGHQIAMEKVTPDGCFKTEYLYDPFGQLEGSKQWWGQGLNDYTLVLSERDEKAQVSHLSILDAQGNKLKTTPVAKKEPDIKKTKSLVANSRGQWVWQESVTDKNGTQAFHTYDVLGRLETEAKKNINGKEIFHVDYRYDSAGNRCRATFQVIGPEKITGTYVVLWRYSPENLLEELIEGAGTLQEKHTHYRHDSCGRLEQLTKPDGVQIHYGYNTSGQLIHFYAQDHSFDYVYRYDSKGNIVEAEDLIHQQMTQRSYNGSHNIIKETLGHGFTLQKEFDGNGRVKCLTFPDQSSIKYEYDAAYLRKVHRFNAEGKIAYTHHYSSYDPSGYLSKAQLIHKAGEISYKIDNEGQCVAIQTPYWSCNKQKNSILTRDAIGQYDFKYTFDPLERVIDEQGIENIYYRYDSLGNRLQDSKNSYRYNTLNQMIAVGDAIYEYDLNGNLISTPSLDCRYDALNRLVEVTKKNGGTTQYIYDPFNRRIEKRGEQNLSFVYDGEMEIGAIHENGLLAQLRVLGQGFGAEIGAAIAIEVNGKAYIPIHDMSGSVACLIDPITRHVVETYRYTAFGHEQIFDQKGKIHSKSVMGNPWRYHSKRKDLETGWIFYGKRYYAPIIGRWTSPDPLGYADGPNLYAFVQNNPVNNLDLYGLVTLWRVWSSFKKGFDEFCERVFGEGFLTLIGYHAQHNTTGFWGEGEAGDKVRVTYINGILTLPVYFDDHVREISDMHGGVNVHFVYRSTWGWAGDMFRCLLVKCGVTSMEAKLLAETWQRLIADMGGPEAGGVIYHYAHSIGSAESAKAYSLLTEAEQSMIHIMTFGSPVLLKNTQPHHKFTNYVSIRDGISLMDPVGYILGLLDLRDNVIFVGEMNGPPFMDHYLLYSAYQGILQVLGQRFVEMYGTAW